MASNENKIVEKGKNTHKECQYLNLFRNIIYNGTGTSEVYKIQVQRILKSHKTSKIVGNTSVEPILVINDSEDEHKTPVKLGKVQQILRSQKISKNVGNTSVAPILVIDDSDDEHKTPKKLGTTICLNSSNEFDISSTSLIDHHTNVENNNKQVVDEIVIFDSDSEEDNKKYVLNKSKVNKSRAECEMLHKLMINGNKKENDYPSLLYKSKVKSAKNTRFTNNTSLQATSVRSLHCPVCLEPLANKEVMSTICGHLFCTNCIKTCIRATKNCPNCRQRLTLKSIHPIFL